MNIKEIKGVESGQGQKLRAAGVGSVEALIERGRTRSDRSKLAEATEIPEREILQWVNRADLMRLKGVGSEYSDLLEATGIDSCLELSHRVPDHLHDKMDETNRTERLVRRIPTASEVERWIVEAKSMARAVEH